MVVLENSEKSRDEICKINIEVPRMEKLSTIILVVLDNVLFHFLHMRDCFLLHFVSYKIISITHPGTGRLFLEREDAGKDEIIFALVIFFTPGHFK